MWCLCFTFFTFGLLLLRAEAEDCPGLPMNSDVRASFNSLLLSQGGEGGGTFTIGDGPFYTCEAQGSTMGTYREVSVVMTFTRNAAPSTVLTRQFELECTNSAANTWSDRSNSLSTPGNGFDYMNSLRTDCASCVTNSPPNENHCQPCDSACNSGLMRCTSDSSSDCCVAFENNGECSDDLNCTETNFVANEQNNYTCACGVTCGSGFKFNSTSCSCILTDTCLANSPCANGVCMLGSTPDQYTCNCTETNFMGTNCSVPVPFSSSSSSSSSSIVPVTSTSSLSPSPTNVLVCSLNGCATCGSTNCCSQCSAGFNREDCVCVSVPTPVICNVRDCATCSSIDCCSECEDGFSTGRDDLCSCVEIGTGTSQRSTVSATPTATVRPPRKSQGVNSSTLAGIAVSIVVGVLMLIVLIALVGYIIYYYIAGAAVAAAHKAKRSTPFANGEAHDNPLYLNPEEVDQL